jgi:hypothetical protein
MNSMAQIETRSGDRKLLREIGEALYGERWQSEMARKLEVEDRAIRRWLTEQNVIPAGVWASLLEILRWREVSMMEARQRLARRVAHV